MNRFLAVTAAIEAGAGLCLVAAPNLVVRLLLGADISGAAVPLGRVAGFALLALGLACWLARGRAASEWVIAMLLYNCGVVVVLGMASAVTGMTGVLLWPAVALHAAMAVWSIISSRRPLG
jgi:multisubunit Na+/H+ antiporter MnhC subunit